MPITEHFLLFPDFRVYNLQESKVTVYNHTECNNVFSNLPDPILPSMVCVTQKTSYSPAGAVSYILL